MLLSLPTATCLNEFVVKAGVFAWLYKVNFMFCAEIVAANRIAIKNGKIDLIFQDFLKMIS